MPKSVLPFKKDFVLIIIISLIAVYGLFAICTAMADPFTRGEQSTAEILDRLNLEYVGLQLLWYVLGLALVIVTMLFDYQTFGKLHFVIYAANVLLLGLVLVLGDTRGGATSWFVFGDRGLQPSELAKLSLIIFLAKRLSMFENGIQRFRDLVPILFYFGVPFALIIAQNDFGTAMVYVVILFGMLLLSGMRFRIFLVLVGVVVLILPVLWFYVLPQFPHAYNRIITFLDPSLDPSGAGYTVAKTRIAIGSGGLFGKGMFSMGVLSQLNYIPSKHTDFIFAVACEAFGFIGAIALIGLYVLMILKLLHISSVAYDPFGSYLVTGIVCMFLAHIVENIGMNVGLMPITGIPLPFFSYGGSSMWTNMIAIGVAMNVSWRRNMGPVEVKMVEFTPQSGVSIK